MIISISVGEDDPMLKFARKFPDQRSPSIPRNRDVIAVAIQQGWKYFACTGDSKHLDITAIFDSSSSDGNYLLDFLTDKINARQNNEKQETVERILNFWEEQSFINEQGRRVVELKDNAVVILKGLTHRNKWKEEQKIILSIIDAFYVCDGSFVVFILSVNTVTRGHLIWGLDPKIVSDLVADDGVFRIQNGLHKTKEVLITGKITLCSSFKVAYNSFQHKIM